MLQCFNGSKIQSQTDKSNASMRQRERTALHHVFENELKVSSLIFFGRNEKWEVLLCVLRFDLSITTHTKQYETIFINRNDSCQIYFLFKYYNKLYYIVHQTFFIVSVIEYEHVSLCLLSVFYWLNCTSKVVSLQWLETFQSND